MPLVIIHCTTCSSIVIHSVHPDISQPSPMWKVARTLPQTKVKYCKAAKVIAYPHFADPPNLCEFCGRRYRDMLIHYVIMREHTWDEREIFWNLILERFLIELSVHFNSLADEELITVLLRDPWDLIFNVKCHIDFLICSINCFNKLIATVDLSTVP